MSWWRPRELTTLGVQDKEDALEYLIRSFETNLAKQYPVMTEY